MPGLVKKGSAPRHVLQHCENSSIAGINTGACFSKSRNFSGLFRASQFPLYPRNAEVLSHQTSQSSLLLFH